MLPRFFRGMLDVRATRVNDTMKLAAAHALAAIIPDSELSEDTILPSMFNPHVVPVIAEAVGRAAAESGFARANVEKE
jgi:malate dehydrogenase (oxaloacetate-decarboxylating)